MADGKVGRTITLPERISGELSALDESYRNRLLSRIEAFRQGLAAARENDISVNDIELLKLFLDTGAQIVRGRREFAISTRAVREEVASVSGDVGVTIYTADINIGGGWRRGFTSEEAATSSFTYEFVYGDAGEQLVNLLEQTDNVAGMIDILKNWLVRPGEPAPPAPENP